MSPKAAFLAHLLTLTGLTALVGTRVQFQRRQQGDAMPSVVFYWLAVPVEHTLDGRHVSPRDGLLAIECYGATGADAEAVAAVLRQDAPAGLDGFSGTMGGTLRVQRLLLSEAGRDEFTPDGSGLDTGVNVVTLEATLSFEE